LKAKVAPGNRYDSPFLPKLIEDLEADFVLADAGYDSKKNIRAVKDVVQRRLLHLTLEGANAKRSNTSSF
jgi:hypothetical protein